MSRDVVLQMFFYEEPFADALGKHTRCLGPLAKALFTGPCLIEGSLKGTEVCVFTVFS